MQVTITSTTDSKEAVLAAQGGLAKENVEEQKPAAPLVKEPAEIAEDPGDSNDQEESEIEGDEEPKEERPKKKGGFQKRIDKLSKQRSAAEQERDYWKQEAQKNQKPALDKQSTETKPPLEGKPNSDNFDTHEAYVEALADWRFNENQKASEQKAKESELKSALQKDTAAFSERLEKYQKENDDFDELIDSVSDVPMSITVQEVILRSENGPELMHELAKNKEEYKRICALPAIAAAEALGRFKERMAKLESPREQLKTTRAPTPIKPVGSKSSGTSSKAPDEMNFQEFKKWRVAHPNA